MVGRRFVLLAVLAVGCGGNRYVAPPPPEVTVAEPVEREVTTWSEFTGHTAAIASVDVRARVIGFLQEIAFQPGSFVNQGDLLFVIEPAPFQAKLDAARADLAGKEANFQAAQAQLEITQAIYQRNAGSKTDLVAKTEARDLAKAAVDAARAALAQAEIDFSYTHVYAPVGGRIDRNLVDLGNVVGSGEATVLATIVHDDPIYAYFDASERALLVFRELQRRGHTITETGKHGPAFMKLLTEEGFPHAGNVDYVANRIDPSTGTIEVRAIFPNPGHDVVPGLFVRVRIPQTRERALLVPDVAVGHDLGGTFLLVVDATDTVQYRRVKLGELDGEMRVVQEGVQAGERVIVNGLQRARPGAKVKPVTAPAAPPTTQPPQATP